MTTKTLADKAGADLVVDLNLALGRLAAAATRSVNLSNEDYTALNAIATAAADTTTPSPVLVKSWEYETVAASVTAGQILGATGAINDYLSHVLIVPSSLSPGAVQIKDGSGSAITIFAGGASSLTTLHPFAVPLGLKATGAGWTVITNAGVTVIAVGDFT